MSEEIENSKKQIQYLVFPTPEKKLLYVPKYDPNFTPAIISMEEFTSSISRNGYTPNIVTVCLERPNKYNYIYNLKVYPDGKGYDKENFFQLERLVKALLWMMGGNKIYISGSDILSKKLKEAYTPTGIRKFDYEFMSEVYDQKFEVIICKKNEIPPSNPEKIKMSVGLDGNRIGFDAGGSDRKVSAVVNGEAKYANETVWYPKLKTDPQYHFDGIMESFKEASKFMHTVDGIGVSTAGIVVDNKVMVSSLFLKVDKSKKNKIQNIFIDCAKEFEKIYKKKIPLVVANDGDVTALAGALELKTTKGMLGIAMGTSQAGGYITPDGSLLGWLNELAFVPIDYNQNAMVDEWSGDYGCGVKYFSQDGIIKLAENAGVKFDAGMSPAEKLKKVQAMIEGKNEEEKQIAINIYLDLGTYMGYTIPYYLNFYDFEDMLVLGRVVSGVGGNLIVARAKEVIENEFPKYKGKVKIHMPDEKSRRVGQSIAAASLPVIN